MKVLMMVHGLPTGGAERNLLALLPRLGAIGVDLRLCTLNDRRDGPLAEVFRRLGLARHDLGARRLADLGALGRLHALLRRERVDLVHCQDPYSAIMAASLRPLGGVPLVMTRHVLDDPVGTAAAAVRNRLLYLTSRTCIDRVIAVSEAVRRRFARLAGLPPERIETVFNGIDPRSLVPSVARRRMRRRLGLASGDRVLVMVAVMRGGKGHEVLFRALGRLRGRVPSARAVIVGDGPDAARLRALAAPLGDRVLFLGDRTDVPDILAAADVLVLPSWSEALPNVLLEAGAAGLPGIATDVGGTGEVLVDGRTGFLIPPGDAAALADAAARLLEDPGLVRSMGAAARRRIAGTFFLDGQAARTREVYRRILEERS